MMLVLVISAAIISVGVRQYQVYKLSSDAELIKANANKLFQAASYFYQMQCRANRPAPATDNNALAPTVTTDPVVIDIQTDLVDTGLLRENFPLNPLVDNTVGWNGYMVQFVRAEEPRLICTQSSSPTTNPYSADCTQTTQVGVIVNWQIQVTARIRNSNLIKQLVALTTADCQTSIDGAGVQNCQTATAYTQSCDGYQAIMNSNPVGSAAYNAAEQDYNDDDCGGGGYNNFLSFQRSPSFSTNRESQSGLWMSNKRVKQFNQMYEIANLYQVLNTSNTPTQYFTCNN
jgi:hypothetical protein